MCRVRLNKSLIKYRLCSTDTYYFFLVYIRQILGSNYFHIKHMRPYVEWILMIWASVYWSRCLRFECYWNQILNFWFLSLSKIEWISNFEENRSEWRWSESGKSWIIDTGVGCFDENQWNEQLLPHDPLYPVILIKLVCVCLSFYVPFPPIHSLKQNTKLQFLLFIEGLEYSVVCECLLVRRK
jgi:hypothetical protein